MLCLVPQSNRPDPLVLDPESALRCMHHVQAIKTSCIRNKHPTRWH
jgi:hypothetical protein